MNFTIVFPPDACNAGDGQPASQTNGTETTVGLAGNIDVNKMVNNWDKSY